MPAALNWLTRSRQRSQRKALRCSQFTGDSSKRRRESSQNAGELRLLTVGQIRRSIRGSHQPLTFGSSSQLSFRVASASAPAFSRKRSSSEPPWRIVLQRRLLDQLALDDDADVRAQPLDDLQDVRRQEDRRAAGHEAGQQVADDARRHRVHPLERLVEEQQVRVGQQRRGQGQLLLHAVRVFQRQLLLLVLQAEQRQQLVDAAADRVARQQVHAADEGEVLAGRQVVEQGQVFGDDADAALRLEGLALGRACPCRARASRRRRARAGR